jgi:hypothetical protein
MEKVSIDTMGPLETAEDGSRYLLVLEDCFSKWVEVNAVPRLGGKVLVDWLADEIIPRWGAPREIILDRGSDMESKELQAFCQGIGIKQRFTAPYHHQSNPVERVNRTILNMLRTQMDGYTDSWTSYVSPTLLALRASKHKSTDASPAEIMFGRRLRLPVDLAYDTVLDTPQGAAELHRRMTEARRLARHGLVQSAAERKKRYDRDYNVSTPSLAENDRVLWKKPGRNKLGALWLGPFRLARQVTETNWLLEGADGTTKEVHANQLKVAPPNDTRQLEILRNRGRPRRS